MLRQPKQDADGKNGCILYFVQLSTCYQDGRPSRTREAPLFRTV